MQSHDMTRFKTWVSETMTQRPILNPRLIPLPTITCSLTFQVCFRFMSDWRRSPTRGSGGYSAKDTRASGGGSDGPPPPTRSRVYRCRGRPEQRVKFYLFLYSPPH